MPHKMDIVKKLRQNFVLDHLQNGMWKNNPLVVELDTTEVCNFACPGCISEDLVRNKTSFSRERLMTLARELYEFGVKAVILIGGGEPLAHPVVGELIKFFGTHDISVGITTNGYFIPKFLDEIATYAAWTRVSMDSATSETFGKLRPTKDGHSAFNDVVSAMRRLAKVKRGKLGYSFLIRTEADGFGITSNIAEIYDAARLAKDIGCDYIEIKPSYNFGGGGINHTLVRHSEERMREAKFEISRLTELESDDFQIVTAINLRDSLDGVKSAQEKDYRFCPAAYLRTLICPSGVYVCPYWRGQKNFCIGDAKADSIQSIWQSERRKSVMQQLDPIKKCELHCLRNDTNKTIIQLMNTERSKIETVAEFDRFI